MSDTEEDMTNKQPKKQDATLALSETTPLKGSPKSNKIGCVSSTKTQAACCCVLCLAATGVGGWGTSQLTGGLKFLSMSIIAVSDFMQLRNCCALFCCQASDNPDEDTNSSLMRCCRG